MEDYLFVLGRDRELSLLELVCYFRRKNIKYEIKDKWNEIVLASLDGKINIEELGGTIKIAKIILKTEDKKELINFINNFKLPNQDKIYFSVNDDFIKNILSKKFKKEVIRAFYKGNINDPSSSLRLDLELIKFKNYLGKVIQISNPKLYKKRDELRPRFDEKKVISIRLAKILINLSEAKNEILDPFCGNGTILQEALLLNLNSYGVDVNVKDARENLSWLNKNFDIKNKFKLIQSDAKNLSRYFNKIEAIVTEPYLGPYLKDYPKYLDALKTINDLELLYKKVFQEFNKVTNKVVIIFPVFKTKNKKILKINVNNIIHNTSFKISNNIVTLPILYKHKKSILEREIWIFDKRKI